jgi:hypothetical protein
MPNDRDVLLNALGSVINLNLTAESGWREGTEWRDPHAGDSLVARGILLRPHEGSSRMYFSEAALVRVLRVAIDAALEDLLANDPPPTAPIDLREDLFGDEGPHKLILLRDEITVR